MKQRRKKPHEKGLAIHSAPSFALGIARCTAKRKQGNRRGGWSSEKMQSGRRRPCHARKATWRGVHRFADGVGSSRLHRNLLGTSQTSLASSRGRSFFLDIPLDRAH